MDFAEFQEFQIFLILWKVRNAAFCKARKYKKKKNNRNWEQINYGIMEFQTETKTKFCKVWGKRRKLQGLWNIDENRVDLFLTL